jgi:hypothetical protein
MEQLTERLLADGEQMLARMESKIDANQAEIRARMDENCKEMSAKMDANQAKTTKQVEMLAEIGSRMNANLKDLKGDIKSSQIEMRSTVCVTRSELKETIQYEMKAIIQPIRSELDETSCNIATETDPNPEMTQCKEDHQEIHKEDAAVMPGGGARKRRRVWILVTEFLQKMRERTRGNIGSRKVPCRANVAWRTRHLIRKIQTWKCVDGERCSPPPE